MFQFKLKGKRIYRLLSITFLVFCGFIISTLTQAELEEDRVAFIIGNSDYSGTAKLANPTNDSIAISEELKKLGFETYLFQNLKVEDIPKLKVQLQDRLKRNTRLVFYYAGHGVQLESKNYLLPINGNFYDSEAVTKQSLYLGDILQAIQKSRPRLSVVILDACRDNPFGIDKSSSFNKGGLARVDPPTSTVIFYATRPGGTASDGTGKNGLFTQFLLNELSKPDLTLEVIFRKVSNAVYNTSKGDQEPWIEGVIREEFVVNHSNAIQPENLTPSIQIASITKPPIPLLDAIQNAPSVTYLDQNQLNNQINIGNPNSNIQVKPEIITLTTEAKLTDNLTTRTLSYAEALKKIEKDSKLEKSENRNTFSCEKDVCTAYKDWSKTLVEERNLDNLKNRLKEVLQGQIKLCEFDLTNDKCLKNHLPFKVYSPIMMFTPDAQLKGIEISELQINNSGGLIFKSDLSAEGVRKVSCAFTDSRLEFLNDRIDFNVNRFACFGIMPSTVKVDFEVILWKPEKLELLVKWQATMISWMAFGNQSGIAKLSLPTKG